MAKKTRKTKQTVRGGGPGKPSQVATGEEESIVMSLADDASAAAVNSVVDANIVDPVIVPSEGDATAVRVEGIRASLPGSSDPTEQSDREVELPQSELIEEPSASAASADHGQTRSFRLGDAIHLMRSLPLDDYNADALLRVVRLTLGQANVNVDDLVTDAVKREEELRARLATLQTEVETLRGRVEDRERELTDVESHLREVVAVRERLLVNAPVSIAVPRRPPPPPRTDIRKPRTRTQKLQRSQRQRPG